MSPSSPAGAIGERAVAPLAKEEVRERLVRARGHLEGVVKMVDDDKAPVEILRQILAVHGALEKTTVMVLEDMLETFMDAPKAKRREVLQQIRESLRDLT
jgi:DNA-binding FrmR family transcriptional regulator